MGSPKVIITFVEKGASAIQRGERGVVALGLKDAAAAAGEYTVLTTVDIPAALSAENRSFVTDALMGYQNTPKKVLLYVMNAAAEDVAAEYTKLEKWLSSVQFNWLAIPTVETDGKAQEIAAWIKTQRTMHRTVKAVLPNTAADNEGIVNLTSSLYHGETEVTPEKSTPRIAGLIAGTPMSISCTYAPLRDFTDCTRLAPDELDSAVDDGKLVYEWDGEKVKISRGVNSFQTTTDTKGESFKKIKIVEIMDMIQDDIRLTAQDNYIGKFANSYDNKCLLITAINAYFQELVRSNLLQSGTCEIDIDAQRNWLQSQGENIEEMDDNAVKTANTGSYVFLKATISILDAMEDITLDIYI